MKGREIKGEKMRCIRKDVQALEVNSCIADQSNMQPIQNILGLILPQGTDIDNNEIYDVMTGETIRRIDEC